MSIKQQIQYHLNPALRYIDNDLSANRHESARIDRQLRGRAGRQGDVGSSRFFISFEDDLMEKYKLREILPRKYRKLSGGAAANPLWPCGERALPGPDRGPLERISGIGSGAAPPIENLVPLRVRPLLGGSSGPTMG